jgi:ribose transport system substrate-binding protein
LDGGAESAQSNITDMLTKFPKDGDVWACWDVRMVGATQAVDASSRKGIRTYGVDGSPDFVAVAAEPKSPASAVAAQQLYEIGKTAVQNVAKYLAGQKVHLSLSFRTC